MKDFGKIPFRGQGLPNSIPYSFHGKIKCFASKSPQKLILLKQHLLYYLANWYLFKLNNRNTAKSCEISQKLTIKTTERWQ